MSVYSDQELPHLHAACDYAVMDHGLCHYVSPAHLHDFIMDLNDLDVAGLILNDNSAPVPLPPPEPPPRLQNSLANTFHKVAPYLTDISVDPKQPAFSVQLICIPSVELDGETGPYFQAIYASFLQFDRSFSAAMSSMIRTESRETTELYVMELGACVL